MSVSCLALEAMLVSMACAVTEGHKDIHGLGYAAMLSPEIVEVHDPCSHCLPVKGKKASFAVVSMAIDSQLRKRDIEGFCDSPYPRPPEESNSLGRKPLKNTFKNCDKVVEV